MADLAINDEDGGDVAEAEVVADLLLGTHQQPPEAVEPVVGDFDELTPRRMAVGVAVCGGSGGGALALSGKC